jgi:hypothetical protein
MQLTTERGQPARFFWPVANVFSSYSASMGERLYTRAGYLIKEAGW